MERVIRTPAGENCNLSLPALSPPGSGAVWYVARPMAAITPQIVAAHGLSQDEYARIHKALGRDPNLVELGIFSAMWSEHCSYKSSRRFLKHLPTKGNRVLQGPGENAGVVEGVVAGIAGYGNCIGVPTVAGEVAFDASYNGNCLVNAFTLGLLKANRIFRGTASGVGNPVIYIGARTGRDGIHGATMASAEFDAESEQKRPTVQVGDPFMEKLLLEACLELFKTDCLVGIQDMGAAGLAPLPDDAPQYDRRRAGPAWQDDWQKLPEVPQPKSLKAALLKVLASPTVASKEWVYRQYDHMVRIGTAVRPGQGDAAVVRFTGQRDGGVAMSVGCNSRWCYLDPRLGAAHAVAETARNVSCVGGEPLAVTDCLNFGNPERPEIMWQFEQACLGIADACAALQTPVVSGNVSLYNETEGKAVFPTPMIGMVGLMDDCAKNAGSWFLAAGDRVAVVGGLGKGRSEERRVGKECRSRWSPYH